MLVHVLFGVLFEMLAKARTQFCKIDGRVVEGMQFGVLVQVQFFAIWGLCWCSIHDLFIRSINCNSAAYELIRKA